jgi:quercetin dioxygenase-like cupin family protein
MHVDDHQIRTGGGFVLSADEGQAFWFLDTLTINKVSSGDTQGQLSIVDHRVPAGFAPPPHIHQASDEALLVLDGEFEGFCGDQEWRAGPGSLVFLPHGIPHGFIVSGAGPGRIIVVVSPGGFDQFVAAAGEPARDLRLPEPVAPRSGPAHPARRRARHPDPPPAPALAKAGGRLTAAGRPGPPPSAQPAHGLTSTPRSTERTRQ